MLRFIRWIIGLTATISLLYIVAINPQTIPLNWNPAAEALDLPLYTIIIATFVIGYLIGTLYLWLTQIPKHQEHNKRIKEQSKLIKKLEQDLDTHNEQEISTDILRD